MNVRNVCVVIAAFILLSTPIFAQREDHGRFARDNKSFEGRFAQKNKIDVVKSAQENKFSEAKSRQDKQNKRDQVQAERRMNRAMVRQQMRVMRGNRMRQPNGARNKNVSSIAITAAPVMTLPDSALPVAIPDTKQAPVPATPAEVPAPAPVATVPAEVPAPAPVATVPAEMQAPAPVATPITIPAPVAPVVSNQPAFTWTLCYAADKPLPEAYANYSQCILDPGYQYISKISGPTLIGYISMCEVNDSEYYYAQAQQQGVLLGGINENWPGAYFVDVRNPNWTTMVTTQLIPAILNKGFKGVMLDTLDDAAYLEQTQPVVCKGMQQAAVNLVQAIRQKFPDLIIVVNRGYDILPQIGNYIDQVLAESVYTDYDFEKKSYFLSTPSDYSWTLNQLRAFLQSNPGKKVLSLDYWNPADTATIKNIYDVEKKNGFCPYVSTIDLGAVIPEPV